jgi:hypothetical protein
MSSKCNEDFSSSPICEDRLISNILETFAVFIIWYCCGKWHHLIISILEHGAVAEMLEISSTTLTWLIDKCLFHVLLSRTCSMRIYRDCGENYSDFDFHLFNISP